MVINCKMKKVIYRMYDVHAKFCVICFTIILVCWLLLIESLYAKSLAFWKEFSCTILVFMWASLLTQYLISSDDRM